MPNSSKDNAASRAGTPATAALRAAKVAFTLHRYDHDPTVTSYGTEAAQSLGVDPARVLKTLVVEVDGRLVVAVVPVTGSLDLKALAAASGGKRATLADPSAAERMTGYVLGGISPLGQRRRIATVIDQSVLEHATVLVSAGRRGLDVELTPQALIAVTGAITSAIGRND